MIIIGIDPGKTIGIAVYDTTTRRIVHSETTTDAEDAVGSALSHECHYSDMGESVVVAIERPRIYHSAGNELCDTIEQVGWMFGELKGVYPPPELAPGIFGGAGSGPVYPPVYLLERRAVVGALSSAMGQQVRGDAGVWHALCDLHPDAMRAPVAGRAGRPAEPPRLRAGSKTKWTMGKPEVPAIPAVEAGPLYGVTSHARQAVAVAWALARHLGEV